MKCSKCGTENQRRAAFCTSCGEPLKQVRRRRQSRAPSGNSGVKALAVVFGILAIGLAVMMGQKQGQERSDQTSRQSAPRAFGMAVQDLASRFLCSCGSCDEPELADCSCPTAIQEKEFIERELKQGTPETDVIKLVNSRFGSIKPQFASLVGGVVNPAASRNSSVLPKAPSASKTSLPFERLTGAAEPGAGGSRQAAGIATPADARQIASRFICACGQCQDHVLSECDCDHGRGAVEMKAFIAYRISQKKQSREEIVQAVAYEYGHLIKK